MEPTPVTAGEEVFAEGERPALHAAEAAVLLDELRAKLVSEPGSRMTLRWRLTRPARSKS